MYKCHKLSKSCRLGDPILHKPSLEEARFVLVMIFNILHFTDLMHNYQSNRSALLIRGGIDLCYQYGISAVNCTHPSCEMPLGPGAKKEDSFRRLKINT